MQMGGMLIGGVLWGVLGDKRGRLSVLFGSIFMYSVANIANGLVQTVEAYAGLRFIAGIGLAGELGAGITLVSEIMPKETRGYGTTIVAAIGIFGAVVAALVGDLFDWRIAYFVGGVMGLALLVLRIGVYESGMFESVKQIGTSRGNFLQLFNRGSAREYVAVILIGVPIWYVIGILITFSPELGRALGMSEAPHGGPRGDVRLHRAGVGDVAQRLLQPVHRQPQAGGAALPGDDRRVRRPRTSSSRRSRSPASTPLCVALGFGVGYWAVFVTIASEQFGTNIRATATTTVPNFVRGAVVLLTSSVGWLRPQLGVVDSALIVGVVALAIASWRCGASRRRSARTSTTSRSRPPARDRNRRCDTRRRTRWHDQ